jgi:glucan phosphoethanolaminetransferase (alkaline phosphatase superfamily)
MENKKVFINAMFPSLKFQYVLLLIIFLILPIIYLLKDAVFQLDKIGINYLLIKFLILLVGIFLFRQIWVFKIITNDQGISYYGFLKRVYASWYEVISIKQSLSPNLGKLKTKNDNFYFPLWMKEENEIYLLSTNN